MPTVTRQEIDSATCHLTVNVTREDLKPKLDSELKRFRQRATIKGFRPGQAPAHYVKSLYGSQIFYDLFNDMVSQELYAYIREQKIDALGQPMPVADQEKKYSFKIDNPDPLYEVTFEVGFVPAFDIKGLGQTETIERLKVSNLDSLAHDDLNHARRRMGERTTPENDIQENDMVRIDARELDDDQPKEGGWATEIVLLVKSIANEATRQDFLSKKLNDTVRFNVAELESNNSPTFIRKNLLNVPEGDDRQIGDVFEGKIIHVSRLAEAELNETFFNNYFGEGKVSDEASAIEALKSGIQDFYDKRSDAMMMRKIQERLMALNNFPLPDAFLRRWIKATNTGTLSDAEIEKDYAGFANNLRWTILRDRLKDQYEILVTNEAIEAAFTKKVQDYFGGNADPMLVKSLLPRIMGDKKQVEETEREIEYDLLFSALKAEFLTEERAVPSEDFHALLDNMQKEADIEAENSIAPEEV
jgi:trigger factor